MLLLLLLLNPIRSAQTLGLFCPFIIIKLGGKEGENGSGKRATQTCE